MCQLKHISKTLPTFRVAMNILYLTGAIKTHAEVIIEKENTRESFTFMLC